MTAALNLTVNGEPRRTAAATIAGLVVELGLKPEKVAVELNGTIVPRSTLGEALAAKLHSLANGIDPRSVSTQREEKNGLTTAPRPLRGRT